MDLTLKHYLHIPYRATTNYNLCDIKSRWNLWCITYIYSNSFFIYTIWTKVLEHLVIKTLHCKYVVQPFVGTSASTLLGKISTRFWGVFQAIWCYSSFSVDILTTASQELPRSSPPRILSLGNALVITIWPLSKSFSLHNCF